MGAERENRDAELEKLAVAILAEIEKFRSSERERPRGWGEDSRESPSEAALKQFRRAYSERVRAGAS